MYISKLPCYVDFKRKQLYVYLDGGESEKIELDEEGAGVLELELFRPDPNTGTLKGLIEKLQEIITKDQLKSIFELWGNSTNIKMSYVAAALEEDRLLAKQVIKLAVVMGIIANSVNSTFKVVNKEEQKTMKEYAEKLKRNISKQIESVDDTLSRIDNMNPNIKNKDKLENITLEKVGGSSINKNKEHSSISKINIPTKKNTIDVITEPTEQELQQELQALQQKLKEDKWNEDETPWTVNDRMHLIQAQLRHIHAQKDAEQYKKDVNSLNVNSNVSKSMTRVERKIETLLSKKVMGPSSKQIAPKKTPLHTTTSVVKKRS